MNLTEIGFLIRDHRKKSGMTQSELAEAVGMSRTSIGDVERGSVDEIGLRKAIRIAECVGLELTFRPMRSAYTLDDAQTENSLPAMRMR